MIPAILARELRESLLEYIDTTIAHSDESVGHALRAHLTSAERGLFKGPYVQIGLPFLPAREDEEIPLEVRPPFRPYAHQMRAFGRLSSRDANRTPLPTLVTTGTGSGKTECFLYPVLDHCARIADEGGAQGIKAILLYPMNALASDQARRLAETIWETPGLKGRVTAGLLVGKDKEDEGRGQKVMTAESVVTDRDTIKQHPPDILLTNYRMLDLLLLRGEDQKLWRHNRPETLRYIVLDELHTYDGAQGGDVACLIRRLRARLESPEGLACAVGTSATLGSGDVEAAQQLRQFAEQLFGQKFDEEAVVTERRLEPGEFLEGEVQWEGLPAMSEELAPRPAEDGNAFLRRTARLWLGDAADELDAAEEGEAGLQTALGVLLPGLELFRNLVVCAAGRGPVEWTELADDLALWDPDFAKFDEAGRGWLLASLLTLVSGAKRREGKRLSPLVSCQVQFWVREMSRVARAVTKEPAFYWQDDRPRDAVPKTLPPVYCRECGHAGWVALGQEGDDHLVSAFSKVYSAYFGRKREVRYVFPARESLELGELFLQYLCPCCLRVIEHGRDEHLAGKPVVCECRKLAEGDEHLKPFAVEIYSRMSGQAPPRDLQSCPACSTDFSMRILGLASASLSSVAVSDLFGSPLNADKKLLAFTDSVQDAAHRAAFFANRTYRIGLRTAIQGTVEEHEREKSAAEPLLLSELGERITDWVVEAVKRGGRDVEHAVAALMPPDLFDLPEYRAFVEKPVWQRRRKVLWRLKDRIQWEATMEYGYSARVGRTLEKVGASCASPNPERLGRVASRLCVELPEEIGGLSGLDEGVTRHFLAGLLERLRVRGGVDHVFIRKYAREHGRWFFLTKSFIPLMSPFGSRSRWPRLLTDRTRADVFDSISILPGRTTWAFDWAMRALAIPEDPAVANDIYRRSVDALVGEGLLVNRGVPEKSKGKVGGVWAIPPDVLQVTGAVARYQCPECGHEVTVPTAQNGAWQGRACLGFRCQGGYEPLRRDRGQYYRDRYRSQRIARIFTAEHTGLLPKKHREEVEIAFKKGDRADAPNLLSCTQTLEMGIDIGDLSATLACSVPPTPANYLQRIGRAGRSTGNAVLLTMANARPHDLYFFENPQEMMAGSVAPPGCFLDAPEMLKRQLLAFFWDRWASKDSGKATTPPKVSMLLSQHARGAYTADLLRFIEANQAELLDSFVGLFGHDLRPESLVRLRAYVEEGSLAVELEQLLERQREGIKSLQNAIARLKTRVEKLKENPAAHEDFEELLAEHEEERHVLRRMVRRMQDKYPQKLFSDGGLLPNYAFPEAGVTLKAVVRGVESQLQDRGAPEGGGKAPKIKGDYVTHEWMRPASQAIRELAPFNTFYAENRKISVDQVDIGGLKQSSVESWVFCEECQYMVPDAKLATGTKQCPACGALGFDDVGRRHDLVRLSQVGANTDHLRSRLAAEDDDRDRRQYLCQTFFEVLPENYGQGYHDPGTGFGFEYLQRVTLREINAGLVSERGKGQTLKIASVSMPETGFLVCADCGVVHPPEDSKAKFRHRFSCTFNSTGRQEQWRNVYLYRQMSSEAIRVRLPSLREHGTGDIATTFKACLTLGLRRRFRGQPVHLMMREQTEPSSEGPNQRFLVLYDTVPGGTGYLKELARKEGMLSVLRMALDVLTSCSCQQDEGRDGCYRCLYAYQDQYEREKVSRRLGVELLGEILRRQGDLEEVHTLSTVPVDIIIESVLERLFLERLGEAAVKGRRKVNRWHKTLREGKVCFELRVGEHKYLVRTQVEVGKKEGFSPWSRPDFLIEPEGRTEMKPVAVFTDGFAYHAMPDEERARIYDDVAKRRAIWESGHYHCWSLSWLDVDGFKESWEEVLPRMLGEKGARLLQQQAQKLKMRELDLVHELTGLSQLLIWLGNPDPKRWAQYAVLYSLAAVADSTKRVDRRAALNEAGRLLKDVDVGSLEVATGLTAEPARLAVLEGDAHLRLASVVRVKDPMKDARLVLRLEDRQEARQKSNFREAWRRYLLLSNVLQFHPGFQVATTESITGAPEAVEPAVDALVESAPEWVSLAAEESPTYGEEQLPEEWGAVLEDALDFEKPVVRALARLGLSVPELGYEPEADGSVVALTVLAWPQQKVAVMTETQLQDAPALEKLDWRCVGVAECLHNPEAVAALVKETEV